MITVTARKSAGPAMELAAVPVAVQAVQEELGDLKLLPVTRAGNDRVAKPEAGRDVRESQSAV